ncbi:MAG: hypothetical protein JNM00_16045 [Flavobacteriales bacterium]|nr:hypothetical protein [Flavobacteriales bacterium]
MFILVAGIGSLFLFQSCRKKDEIPPQVVWSSPVNASTFYFPSNIHVAASLSDDQKLVSASLRIYHLNSIYTLVNQVIPVAGGASFQYDKIIPFDDIYAPSGTYAVELRVQDEENETISFRTIVLYEAPRELRQVLVTSTAGSVMQIDSLQDNSFVTAFSQPFHFRFGEVDSRNQFLHVAGLSYEGIMSLRLPELEIMTEIPTPFDLSDELFTCSTFDDHLQRALFGGADGMVRAVDGNGALTETFMVTSGSIPIAIAAQPDRLAVLCQSPGLFRIEIFNAKNGVKLQSLQVVGGTPTNLVSHSNGADFWILGYEGENSIGWHYITATNTTDQLSQPLIDGSIITGICTGNGSVYVASDNVGVRRFDTADLAWNSSESATYDAVDMAFDEVNDNIWVLENSQIHQLDGVSMVEEATFAVSSGAQRVLLVYNK